MWKPRSKRDTPTQIEIRARHLQRLPSYLVDTPFEWLVSIMCILGGIGRLFGEGGSGSLDRVVPNWMGLAWAILLSLGGVTLFVGLTFRRLLDLQRQGYGMLASAITVYGICIVAVAGTKAPVTTIGLYIVFASVCAIRRYQLTTVHMIAEYRVRQERDSK